MAAIEKRADSAVHTIRKIGILLPTLLHLFEPALRVTDRAENG